MRATITTTHANGTTSHFRISSPWGAYNLICESVHRGGPITKITARARKRTVTIYPPTTAGISWITRALLQEVKA